ncbi:DUF4157 domain-containing protein [Chitinophaga sp. NPDC101104]|uniref:eCIS core domain-containing protein n=1 Tax=Chitinophaga sp. NPDC101104 TaxID=3390561 RepID=UPI003CFC8E95
MRSTRRNPNNSSRKPSAQPSFFNPPQASATRHKLASTAGKGEPIPAPTRHFMENAFGADFSNVHIHTGASAAELNADVQAKAFTYGSDIYFDHQQYQPHTPEGQHLLAHELTHVLQQGNTSKRRIQRADIHHRKLTWADFTADVPKKTTGFEAATKSDIEDFDVSKYPFKKLTETENGTSFQSGKKVTDCEKGKDKDKKAAEHPEKYKAYKVNIEGDTSKLKVKAYMRQEESWAKKWLYDPKEREAHADTFVPACESQFNKSQTSSEKACDNDVKTCAAEMKKKKLASYKIYNTTVTDPADCGNIKPNCVKDRMSSVKYQWKNHNNVKVEASKLGDCKTSFKKGLINTGLADSSTSLLNHEQRHFDITHQVAEKISTEMQTLASSFATKEVEACGKGNALAAAEKELKSQRKKLSDKMKAIRKTLGTYQKNYDNETNHSKVVKAQDWWNRNIDAGLPKSSGVKDKFI